ncbi:MAG TPA: SRPBCC domain-containing protein [Pyrinomonadaceae bacterium]|nr:SRPBCC domain-containing protein [Pyrinomonadaceae bacterium]
MREIHTEIEIEAAPEEVWRVLTDFGAYPSWNPFVKSVSGEPREGGRLEIFVQVPGGRGMRFTPEVLRAEPARELRWIGRMPLNLFNGEHIFRLEPAGPGRTRFHHGERFTGLLIPFMGGTLRKVRRGYLLMNEALKARVEGAAGGTR